MAKKKVPSKTGERRFRSPPKPPPRPTASAPFPIVAIGASAGGLEAFTDLLKALPAQTGMAFVLIQHLEPLHTSALPQLLSKASRMPVVEVSDGLVVEPDHVYVIPPNKRMTIRTGALRLAPRSGAAGLQHPIDAFATALAEERTNPAIGVVLSGAGSDGSKGLQTIKASGGVTFAQDPKTAQYTSMPLSAMSAGAVDFVLPPKRIAAELVQIGSHPYVAQAREVPDSSDLARIYMLLRSVTGVDLALYKPATVRRRIARRMALQNIESMDQYLQLLRRNREEAETLADEVFVQVTSFFRDPACFEALQKQVLSKLLRQATAEEPIRIWVAGCSSGEEAYSIAMLLLEQLGPAANRIRIQIFGSDIRESAVEHARSGIYSEAAVAGVSPARLKRFFTAADHGYQVNQALRDLCVFARHDLAKDPPFSRLDLISCRNVLIYMAEPLQRRVLSVFQYALKPRSYLFLGKAESISEYSDLFTTLDRKNKIFERKPGGAHYQHLSPAAEVWRQAAPELRAAAAPAQPVDFRKEAERVLLDRYTPPALIVDSDLHIVHFQGDVSPYLAPATGQPSFHLLKMVRPELVIDLRTAIYKAKKERVPVRKDHVSLEQGGPFAEVRLDVQPLQRGKAQSKKCDFLVVFQPMKSPNGDAGRPAARTGKTHDLMGELASTREQLRALIAEHETAEEEMKAANEEILSSNEELQSTNEELETAKEELQSTNEELVTLNDELQHRNSELGVLTRDLTNLLTGVDIPVLVLDAELRVRRFTPVAAALFNLMPVDVGRPFTNIASNLDVPDWPTLLAEVAEKGQSVEREVQDRSGHWYSMRMRPYKSSGREIEGVLIVMLDMDVIHRALDESRSAAGALQRSESMIRLLLESASQGILAVTESAKITWVNGMLERLFGYKREELLGRSVNLLVPTRLHPRHEKQHQEFFAHPKARPMGIGLDLLGRRKDGTEFPVEVSLSFMDTEDGRLGIAFVNDITERKRMEDLLRQREGEMNMLLDNAPDVIVRFDRDFRYTYVNARTEKLTGLQRETMVGKTPGELPMPGPVVDIVTGAVRRVFETGRPDVAELTYPSPGGETRWEARFIPEFGENGVVRSVLNVGRDFTERKRLEQAAQAHAEEVRALAANLLSAQEEERRRVSRELHDQICQQLASLAIEIGELAANPPPPEEAAPRLRTLQARVVKASEETRHMAYQLHPSVLDDLGLVASLRTLCEEFTEREGIDVAFTSRDRTSPVPREAASCFYRVAQEALQNIVKHAKAKHVSVALKSGKGGVRLVVEDDGAGFGLEKVRGKGTLGLVSMEERVRLANGKLSIASQPGRGTRIEVFIPSLGRAV